MTTAHHTPLVYGGALTQALMEAPLGSLDAAIDAVVRAASGTITSLTSNAAAGQATLIVASSAGFAVGDPVTVGQGATADVRIVATVPDATHLTVTVNLANPHVTGEAVSESPVEVTLARGGEATIDARLDHYDEWAYNVKAYPYLATGLGVADDSAPIQAAIDACCAAGGGTVFFPLGTYRCNVILKAGVTLRGASGAHGYVGTGGLGITRLVQAGVGACIDTPAGPTKLFGVAVTGLTIVGLGSATAGSGIRFRAVWWGKIADVQVTGFGDEGVALESLSVGCVIVDVLAINCVLNRTRAAVIGALDADGTDHYLDRIEASASLVAVDAPMYIMAIVLRGSNHFVSNSVGELSNIGVWDQSSNSRFTNVRADLNWGHGFWIGGQSVYAGCLALNNGQGASNTYSGFYFQVGSQTNVLSACLAVSTVAAVHKWGFADYAAYAAIANRQTFAACQSFGHGTAPFLVQDGGYGSGVVLPPAINRQDAMTATPDVTGSTVAAFTAWTGSTTITNLTGGLPGQSIAIFGNATITIANNANIKTNTGAAKVMPAILPLRFTMYGGIWYEDGS